MWLRSLGQRTLSIRVPTLQGGSCQSLVEIKFSAIHRCFGSLEAKPTRSFKPARQSTSRSKSASKPAAKPTQNTSKPSETAVDEVDDDDDVLDADDERRHVSDDAASDAANMAAAESSAEAECSPEMKDAITQLQRSANLPRWLARACVRRLGIDELLPIQRAAWQPLVDLARSGVGQDQLSSPADRPHDQPDFMVQSPTGSGKTLAYLLPILSTCLPAHPPPPAPVEPTFKHKNVKRLIRRAEERLRKYKEENGLKAIIVAPSRELALQIYAQTQALLQEGVDENFAPLPSSSVAPVSPVPPSWRASCVKILLPGNSLYQRMKELTDSPPSILIATPSPLLELLTEPAFMDHQSLDRIDAFWQRQKYLLDLVRTHKLATNPGKREELLRKKALKKEQKKLARQQAKLKDDSFEIDEKRVEEEDPAEDDADQAADAKVDDKDQAKLKRTPFTKGMMLDKEIEKGAVRALMTFRPDEKHLPQSGLSSNDSSESDTFDDGSSSAEPFQRFTTWPKNMPLPRGAHIRRPPSVESVRAERVERRTHRNEWVRLEAMSLTTNQALLRSLRVLVLDEPDVLLEPPHPHTPLCEQEKRRMHPKPMEFVLQRVMAIQHLRDPELLDVESASLARAIVGPRLVCVSATVSALLRLYLHRARTVMMMPLLQLTASRRVRLILPESNANSSYPSLPLSQSVSMSASLTESLLDNRNQDASAAVLVDPRSDPHMSKQQATATSASSSAPSAPVVKFKLDEDGKEEKDESAVDAELEEAALRELGEFDERLPEGRSDEDEDTDEGLPRPRSGEDDDDDVDDYADVLGAEALQQRNWFRDDDQLHSEAEMVAANIGDPFAGQRYGVPEQIQHKFIQCDDLGKVKAFVKFVQSYRSAANIWRQVTASVSSSSSSSGQDSKPVLPPIPAILAILPDTAPIDRVVMALGAVGLRVMPLHRGLLAPLSHAHLVRDDVSASRSSAPSSAASSSDDDGNVTLADMQRLVAAQSASADAAVLKRMESTEEELKEALDQGRADDMNRTMHLRRRQDFLHKIQIGSLDVVVTTERTARGLDLPGLQVVALLFSPRLPKDYVHLAGRVGRMGQPGLCVSFASPMEMHRCMPRHAHALSLEIEEWTTDAAAFHQSVRQSSSTSSLISSQAQALLDFGRKQLQQQPLVAPHLIPTFLHLWRHALLPSTVDLLSKSTASSSPSSPSPVSQSPLLRAVSERAKLRNKKAGVVLPDALNPTASSSTSSSSLLQCLLNLPQPKCVGRMLSGSGLRLAQRMKSSQKLQRRHQRLRDELQQRVAKKKQAEKIL